MDLEEAGEDFEPIPPAEILARPHDPDELPPRSGLRQMWNLIEKTPGWHNLGLTYSRGPRVGSKGTYLGNMADCIVLRAYQDAGLDGSVRVAVGSWEDGAFDFAYIGTIRKGRLAPERVTSKQMKDWIKA